MTLIRAQTGNDVVYLLQGGKLEGEIIENVADSFIVIRMENQTKRSIIIISILCFFKMM